jgi:hypothetical protein
MISTKAKNIKNITSIEDEAIIKVEGRNEQEVGIKYSDFVKQLPFKIKSWYSLPIADPLVWDYSLGYNAEITLGVNSTLAEPTNVEDGDYGTLVIIQGPIGGKTLTLPASFKVVNGGAGAITLSLAANAVDSISWIKKGNDFLVTIGLNFT